MINLCLERSGQQRHRKMPFCSKKTRMEDYRVGIYVRLSRDDERRGESLSIENQKRMLLSYCEKQKWKVEEIFVDDGWSGTSFARPAFNCLMEAVKGKRINLVLVKDLSRLGRDYIQVGTYTDSVFPYYGCRFIALNDGVDTFGQNDDISMIFKNVMNDIYARDTSKKIRAVRRANAECGKFMGYKAPYGYQRDPLDRHCLIIDPEAAEVVKRIFDLRSKGAGMQEIANHLNAEGILNPRDYAKGIREKLWCRETIRSILKNEAYIGNMVQLKCGNLSYKDRRQRIRPPETWVRVCGTHEAIVSSACWNAVRDLDERRSKARKRKETAEWEMLLRCRHCGRRMEKIINYKKRKSGVKEYTYFLCRGHICIGKTVLERKLGEEVLRNLNLVEREEKRALLKREELWNLIAKKIEIGGKREENEIYIWYRFKKPDIL